MSKYNRTLKQPRTATTNLAGGDAYTETSKLELAGIVLTSFLKDQFYRSADQTTERIVDLITKDTFFAAKAAVYARHKMGMRSVSHLIASEIGDQVKGEQWTRRFFEKVVRRPDDVMEILACHKFRHPMSPLPNSMKKGLGAALSLFDAYQLAKYKTESADITLVDAVNLVHPKHTAQLGALMKGTLKSPDTWEVLVTQAGSDVSKKSDTWRKLVESSKIGYFALLRNLRNIIQSAPDSLDKVCELLRNEKRIRQSLVLPFRFQTAIEALDALDAWQKKRVLAAISDAVDISLKNVPRFEGPTLIALDDSGSMMFGNIPAAKIGALFAVVMLKAMPDADLMCFSSRARYIGMNSSDSTLTMADALKRRFTGGGTNFHAIFESAQRAYDRVIILSDMQSWMAGIGGGLLSRTFKAYKDRFECTPKVYSFDLAGYGTLQFPEPDVFCLAGFGDKTLDILAKLDADRNALIAEIESVTF